MTQEKTSAAVQWLFRCSGGYWSWRAGAADGSILAASQGRFGSLMEAIGDAQRNGFSTSLHVRSAL
jgi:hypothetical protein